jgi:hypothetical protein
LDKPDLGHERGICCIGARGHPGQGDEVASQVGLVVVAGSHGRLGQGWAVRRDEERRGVLEAEEPRVGLGREAELAAEALRDEAPAPSGLVHERLNPGLASRRHQLPS